MKKRSISVFLFVFCFLGLSYGQTLVSADEFKKQIEQTKKPIILDVRTEAEYQKGHVEGAINANIRTEDFDKIIKKIDKKQTVFVYCGSGGRSRNASKKLSEAGFKKIVELKGGLSTWKNAGFAQVSDNP